MKMSIFDIVKKYQKRILIVFTVVIALSFGVTTSMVAVFAKISEKPAGVYFGKKISPSAFFEFKFRWNRVNRLFRSATFFSLAEYLNFNGALSDDAIESFMSAKTRSNNNRGLIKNEGVWELLILLHEAEANKLYVPDNEVLEYIINTFSQYKGPEAFNAEMYKNALTNFEISEGELKQTVREFLQVQKLTQLIGDSTVVSYKDVYKIFEKENSSFKVKIFSYDISKLINEVKNVSKLQILDYYKNNYKNITTPVKASFSYLFSRIDDFKEKVTEPPQEEIRSFYDKNKDSLKELYEEKDGKKTYKPLNSKEVQDFIINKLKEEKARELARDEVKKIEEYLFFHSEKINELQTLVGDFKVSYKRIENAEIDKLDEKLGLGADLSELKDYLKNTPIPTNKLSSVLPVEKGFLLVQLLNRQKSERVGFQYLTEDLTKKIEYLVKKQKAKEIAQKKLQEIKDKIKKLYDTLYAKQLSTEGSNSADSVKKQILSAEEMKKNLSLEAFSKVLNELKLTPVESDYFTSKQGVFKHGPSLKEIASRINELSIGDYDVECTTENCYLFQLIDVKLPPVEDFNKYKQAIIDRLKYEERKKQIKSFVTYLKGEKGANYQSFVKKGKEDSVDDYGNK